MIRNQRLVQGKKFVQHHDLYLMYFDSMNSIAHLMVSFIKRILNGCYYIFLLFITIGFTSDRINAYQLFNDILCVFLFIYYHWILLLLLLIAYVMWLVILFAANSFDSFLTAPKVHSVVGGNIYIYIICSFLLTLTSSFIFCPKAFSTSYIKMSYFPSVDEFHLNF